MPGRIGGGLDARPDPQSGVWDLRDVAHRRMSEHWPAKPVRFAYEVNLLAPPDYSREIESQSLAYGEYGNFTYHTLEYVPGVGVMRASHDNSSGDVAQVNLLDQDSASLSVGWYQNYGYGPMGLAFMDGDLYFTAYAGNNANLLRISASGSFGSRGATTVISNGFGYGGVPLVGMTAAGESAIYRATPVSTTYSWGGLTGIERVLGDSSLPDSITFDGVSSFQDLTFDGENFYLLSPTKTRHDNNTSGADHVDLRVHAGDGSLLAHYEDLIEVSSGETPTGICFDWDEGALHILVGESGTSPMARKLHTWDEKWVAL